MKLAISGSSSTGKTTLLDSLITDSYFMQRGITRLSLDTRKILEALSISPNDLEKDSKKTRKFQWETLKAKKLIESKQDYFITDRSYIDLAGYWLARTQNKDQETQDYIAECKQLSFLYDLHIFLPHGRIPFVHDGFRPEGQLFQKTVAEIIRKLLPPTNVITIESCDNVQAKKIIVAHIVGQH